MKKMNAVLAGWLVVALTLSLSTTVYSAEPRHAGGAESSADSGAKAKGFIQEYKDLRSQIYDSALKVQKIVGNRIVPVTKGKEDLISALSEITSHRIKINRFCKEDASAQALADFLDEFVKRLNATLKGNKPVSEKFILTFVSQLKKFMEAKKEGTDAELKLIAAAEKFASKFSEKLDAFPAASQVADTSEDIKKLVELMNKAVEKVESQKKEEVAFCSFTKPEESGGSLADAGSKSGKAKPEAKAEESDETKPAADEKKPTDPGLTGDQKPPVGPGTGPTPPGTGQQQPTNPFAGLEDIIKRFMPMPKKETPEDNKDLEDLKDAVKTAKDMLNKMNDDDKKGKGDKNKEDPLKNLPKNEGKESSPTPPPTGGGSGSAPPSGGGGDKGQPQPQPQQKPEDKGEEFPNQNQGGMPMGGSSVPAPNTTPPQKSDGNKGLEDILQALAGNRTQPVSNNDWQSKALMDILRTREYLSQAAQQAGNGIMNVRNRLQQFGGRGATAARPLNNQLAGGKGAALPGRTSVRPGAMTAKPIN